MENYMRRNIFLFPASFLIILSLLSISNLSSSISPNSKLFSAFKTQNDFLAKVKSQHQKMSKLSKDPNRAQIKEKKVSNSSSNKTVPFPTVSNYTVYPQTGNNPCQNLASSCLNLIGELQSLFTYLKEMQKTLESLIQGLKILESQKEQAKSQMSAEEHQKYVGGYEKVKSTLETQINQIRGIINNKGDRIRIIESRLRAVQTQLEQCGVKDSEADFLIKEQNNIIISSNYQEGKSP